LGSYRLTVSPYLPREQHAKLTASAGVTDVTGHASPRSSFFGRARNEEAAPSRETSSAPTSTFMLFG